MLTLRHCQYLSLYKLNDSILGSNPGLVMWDLWWTKRRWGRFSPSTFSLPCQSSFHQFLHNHHHLSSGAGTIGQQWRHYQETQSHPTKNKKKLRVNYEVERVWKEAVLDSRVTSPAFSWRGWGKLRKLVRIFYVPTKIRVQDLPNKNVEYYCYTSLVCQETCCRLSSRQDHKMSDIHVSLSQYCRAHHCKGKAISGPFYCAYSIKLSFQNFPGFTVCTFTEIVISKGCKASISERETQIEAGAVKHSRWTCSASAVTPEPSFHGNLMRQALDIPQCVSAVVYTTCTVN
jgi:hypothetical protein